MNPQTNTAPPEQPHRPAFAWQEGNIHKAQQLLVNNSTYQFVYLKIKRSHFQVWMNNGTQIPHMRAIVHQLITAAN